MTITAALTSAVTWSSRLNFRLLGALAGAADFLAAVLVAVLRFFAMSQAPLVVVRRITRYRALKIAQARPARAPLPASATGQSLSRPLPAGLPGPPGAGNHSGWGRL